MEWESIVNQHSGTKKQNEHQKRRNKYLHNVVVSSAVATAFLVATVFGLVHKGLGEFGMATALMIAFFNLGRAKESK
jgi:hypothetical protein